MIGCRAEGFAVKRGSLADPGSDRDRPRAVPLHRCPRVVSVTNPMPQRPRPVDQLVKVALRHLCDVAILDQRQRVISAQQPNLAGVGSAIIELELTAQEQYWLHSACELTDRAAAIAAALEGRPLYMKGSQGQDVSNPLLAELRQFHLWRRITVI